ncbi:MAG: hypothetical protein KDA28_14570, partial [Phycisphaerales bacterium]|nr:hypothetical protein [Phycisphaerales bacterium]
MRLSSGELESVWEHPGDGSLAEFWCGDAMLCASSTPSPARPESNEDHLLAMPVGSEGVLLAIADGCGGMPAGDRASAAAIAALASALEEAGDDDVIASILAGFD